MAEVEFFFDPSCPWTWVTSRWLETVAPQRHIDVTWRTWSLPMKNEGRELPASMPEALRQRILAGQAFATGALRVLEAAGAEGGNEARGRLYTELGRRFHGDGHGEGRPDPDVVNDALAAAGLPAALADAAGDEKWDEKIRDNMEDIRGEVGDDVGVPIVAVRVERARHAMSGPVMTEVPPLERALALWDAVATVVSEPAVSELKRHRHGGPHSPELTGDGRAV